MTEGVTPPAVRGQALGLAVRCERELPGLVPGAAGTGGRAVILEAGGEEEGLTSLWAPARPETLHERRRPDGTLVLAIHRDAELGYRIEAPGHGLHVVGADGRRVRAHPAPSDAAAWLRLLFAQVLPLAATLQGRELLHASAVAWGGQAVALVGPSGAGKSSVATRRGSGGDVRHRRRPGAQRPRADRARPPRASLRERARARARDVRRRRAPTGWAPRWGSATSRTSRPPAPRRPCRCAPSAACSPATGARGAGARSART